MPQSFDVNAADRQALASKSEFYQSPFFWLTLLFMTVSVVLAVMLGNAPTQNNATLPAVHGATYSSDFPMFFSSVVGDESSTSIMGIGALSGGTGASTSDWAPWGLALSGNGFMAMGAAAGALRALNTAGVLDGLASISSVSGGTWFLTQFAYSPAFHKGVIDTSIDIDTWFSSYQKLAIQGMMSAATATTWEGTITGLHNGFDPALESMSAVKNPSLWAGTTQTDLLFGTTLVGGSLMSDNSTIVQLSSVYGENGAKVAQPGVRVGESDAFYSNPAYWSVSSANPGWSIPGVDMPTMRWTNTKQKGVFTGDADKVLPTPTVTKISSMSSAANGITANPELASLYQPQGQFFNHFGSQAPGNGVCSTPGQVECNYPAMMAIDGCYVDNLGFAINVGHLQKKYPGKNLRMMAVSSEICDRTVDPTCVEGVKASAFRSLFAESPHPTVEGWLPNIVPGPDRTIFAEKVTDYEALGQQTGYGGMTFVTGTFTTVRNDQFGVAAGTKVSILVLNVNGQKYVAPFGSGVPAGATDAFSSNALHAYNSVNQILTALSTNGKVDSSTAFMYYQTVKTAASAQAELFV